MAFAGFPYQRPAPGAPGPPVNARERAPAPPEGVPKQETNVQITFDLPSEAAKRLAQLAESEDIALRQLGILSLQIQGGKLLSLTLAGSQNDDDSQETKKVPEDFVATSSLVVTPVATQPVNVAPFVPPVVTPIIPSILPPTHPTLVKTETIKLGGVLKRPANSSGSVVVRPGFHASMLSADDIPEKKLRKQEAMPSSKDLMLYPAGAFPSVSSLSVNNGYPTDQSHNSGQFFSSNKSAQVSSELNTQSHLSLITRINKAKVHESNVKSSLSSMNSSESAGSSALDKSKRVRLNPNTGLLESGLSGGDTSSEGETEESESKSIKSIEMLKRGCKIVSRRPMNPTAHRDEDASSGPHHGDMALKLKLKLPQVSSARSTVKKSAASHLGESQFDGKSVEPKLPKLILSMRDKTVKMAGSRFVGSENEDNQDEDDEEFDSIKLKRNPKLVQVSDRISFETSSGGTGGSCDRSNKHLEVSPDTKFPFERTTNHFKENPSEFSKNVWSHSLGFKCSDEINLRLADKVPTSKLSSENLSKLSAATNTIAIKKEGSQLLVTDKSHEDQKDKSSHCVISNLSSAMQEKTEQQQLDTRLELKTASGQKSDQFGDTSRVDCPDVGSFNLPSRDSDSHVHQGDDSGIESMDTLSEKSPNQGENQHDEKIERDLKDLESHSTPTVQPQTSDRDSSPSSVKQETNISAPVQATAAQLEPTKCITEGSSSTTSDEGPSGGRSSLSSVSDSKTDAKTAAADKQESTNGNKSDVVVSSSIIVPNSSLSSKSSNNDQSHGGSAAMGFSRSAGDQSLPNTELVPLLSNVGDSTLLSSDQSKPETIIISSASTVTLQHGTHLFSSAPSGTPHLNGGMNPGLQVRSAMNVPSGAKMVPVKLVSVSGEGNVRLVRVSPVKTSLHETVPVITNRTVVIKSSMLKTVAPKVATNPTLLPAHLANSQPLSPSLLNNVKDTTGPPPSVYSVLGAAEKMEVGMHHGPMGGLHSVAVNQDLAAASQQKSTSESVSVTSEAKEKVLPLPASTTATLSSLSITPVWSGNSNSSCSGGTQLSTNVSFQDVVDNLSKNRCVVDPKLAVNKPDDAPAGLRFLEPVLASKLEDKQLGGEALNKNRARQNKKLQNSDFGGSLLRPLLQKEDPVGESSLKTKPRLKSDADPATGNKPEVAIDEHSGSETGRSEIVHSLEVNLEETDGQKTIINSSSPKEDDNSNRELVTAAKKMGRNELLKPNEMATSLKAKGPLSQSPSVITLDDGMERRSFRQQIPASKLTPAKSTTATTKTAAGTQKINMVEIVDDMDSAQVTDWATKTKRVTPSSASTSLGGLINPVNPPSLPGTTSTIHNSCNVVIEANKNLTVKRIKTRSAKTTDDQVESKRRRLKLESL